MNSIRRHIDIVEEAGKVRGLTFSIETHGFSHGQFDHVLVASLDGRPVGKIDFSEYEGEIAIKFVKTAPDMTRRGIATQMLRRLQAEYPGVEIAWGWLTDDGAKLRSALPHDEVDNPTMRRRIDLLPRLMAKRDQLDKWFGALKGPLSDTELEAAEVRSDLRNRLEDMIRRLEHQTFGKKRTKSLVRLESARHASMPPTLYHGTFAHHLPSIRQHGLGGVVSRRNYEMSRRGVYLTDDPDAADSWVSDNQFGTQGEVVVLTVNTRLLDPALLEVDENDDDALHGGTSYRYRGTIPETALSRMDDGPLTESRTNITDRPAFKAWFGNSKVVDRKGRPLVVYHGTDQDFSSFHPGSHFGSARAANHRLNDRRQMRDGSQQMMPVYLRITNPLHVTDMAASDEAALLNAIIQERREKEHPDEVGDFDAIDLSVARREGAYKAAQMAGYDGLVYDNAVEDRGNTSWVIFDPSQVKSAIGNVGTFDPNSVHIHEGQGKPFTHVETEWGTVQVWQNPTRMMANRLLKRFPHGVRGIVYPDVTLVWDAEEAIHADIANGFRPEGHWEGFAVVPPDDDLVTGEYDEREPHWTTVGGYFVHSFVVDQNRVERLFPRIDA